MFLELNEEIEIIRKEREEVKNLVEIGTENCKKMNKRLTGFSSRTKMTEE